MCAWVQRGQARLWHRAHLCPRPASLSAPLALLPHLPPQLPKIILVSVPSPVAARGAQGRLVPGAVSLQSGRAGLGAARRQERADRQVTGCLPLVPCRLWSAGGMRVCCIGYRALLGLHKPVAIRPPTLQGPRGTWCYPPVCGCRQPEHWASGLVPPSTSNAGGGCRHCSESLRSEPCKKGLCWESTALALGTAVRQLGCHPSRSIYPATCEVLESVDRQSSCALGTAKHPQAAPRPAYSPARAVLSLSGSGSRAWQLPAH